MKCDLFPAGGPLLVHLLVFLILAFKARQNSLDILGERLFAEVAVLVEVTADVQLLLSLRLLGVGVVNADGVVRLRVRERRPQQNRLTCRAL
jgi:hypothetical protein